MEQYLNATILFSHPQQKINLVKEHARLAKKSKKTTIIKKKKDTATTTMKNNRKNTPVTSSKRKIVVKKKQRGKVLRNTRRNSGFEMLSQAAELHELQSSTLIAKIGVSSSESPKYYTAKDNDTPFGIAKTFQVPLYKLIRANKERYPSLLIHSRLFAETLIQVSHLDKTDEVKTKTVKVRVTVGSTSKKEKKKIKLSKKVNAAINNTVATATRSSRRITVDKSTTTLEDTAASQEDIGEDNVDATTPRKMDNKMSSDDILKS